MPTGVHTGKRGRRPGQPKRNKEQSEIIRTIIVDGIRRGKNKSEIGRELGISQSQVTYDWNKSLANLQKERGDNLERLRTEQIEQVKWVADEARLAWDRANGRMLEEIIQQVLEQVDAGLESDEHKIPDKFHITLKSTPSSDFLQTVLKCIDKQCVLLGIEKPQLPAGVVNNLNVVQTVDWTGMVERRVVEDQIAQEIKQIEQLVESPKEPSHEERATHPG
jgi:hypothetical protein